MARPRKKADEVNAAAILDAVKGLKPEDVVSQVGELQMRLQGTLAGLSAAIAGKVEQMQKVDEAIVLKTKELQELHNIDAVATTIEDMAAQQQEIQDDWDKQTEEKRAAWREEQAERMKKWQREQEEHEYTLAQMLKKKKDDIEAIISHAQRAEAIRQEDLTRKWQDREDELTSKEEEVQKLQEEVTGFEEKLKSEVNRAEKIVENSVKRHYEHQMELMKKDVDAADKLHAAEVGSLRSKVTSLEDEMKNLQRTLEAARQDAKEVTAAALESASGRRVTEALQKVVDGSNAPSTKK